MTLAEKLLLATNKEVKGAVEFVSSTAMTITPKYTNSGVTLQYSLNGSTWTTIASGATTPSANIIYFRGQATGTKSLYTGNDTGNAWIFTGASNLEVNGDITMLLQDVLGNIVSDTPIGLNAFGNMFLNCTSLVKAPSLPSTTLNNYCYAGMLQNCTSLITAPTLPSTTLAIGCYNNMFRGCTSLTTLPALPATTLASNCYYGMFHSCTSLTTPPVLPATTLATSCYLSMFHSCTSLTTVPALPATTLASNCYNGMFYGCTKIKLSATKTGGYVNEYRVPTVGTGVTADIALTNMFGNTGGTFKSTPTINTTYYTENQVI